MENIAIYRDNEDRPLAKPLKITITTDELIDMADRCLVDGMKHLAEIINSEDVDSKTKIDSIKAAVDIGRYVNARKTSEIDRAHERGEGIEDIDFGGLP